MSDDETAARPGPAPDGASGVLDPEDWDDFARRAHAMLDVALAHLKGSGDGPVWQPPPQDLIAQLGRPLEPGGLGAAATDQRIRDLMPYGVGNTHSRFFGWVHGAGTPSNLIAEIAAAAINANCGGRNHAALHVEKQVVNACRDLFGFPETTGGLVVSGTSMATIIAIKAARDQKLRGESRRVGVGGWPLTGYASTEAHSCVRRAFDLLGLGSDALRVIDVDERHQIDTDKLEAAINADRIAGHMPFLVTGNAGTVNAGAIDDLSALADLARRNGLWLHVDGAFGAFAILSPEHRGRLRGIDRADSLAFDFHKWPQVNYDAGCVLIRDQQAQLDAFSQRPHYLAGAQEGLAAGAPWPVDLGPELSRGFRALKVWAHLLEHGFDIIGEVVARNCEQAAYLAARVDAHPQLERLAPAELNICCFRYNPGGLYAAALDALNQDIVERLQLDGVAAPSTTWTGGHLAIRVNITNHRTQMRDIDSLVEAVISCGERLCAGLERD